MGQDSPTGGVSRAPLAGLVALITGEVLAVSVGVFALAADAWRASTPATASSAVLAVCAVGAGTGLGLAARALWRGRRWGRAPVATWQIMQALVAASAPWEWWVRAVLALVAITALVLLAVPSVVASTTAQTGPGPSPSR